MGRLLLLVLVLSGCADPRDEFVGKWNGYQTIVGDFSAGVATYQGVADFEISKAEEDSRIQLTICGSMTATVNEDSSFTLDSRVCPASQGFGCTFSASVLQGRGVPDKGNLTITHSGILVASGCDDPSYDESANYVATISVHPH